MATPLDYAADYLWKILEENEQFSALVPKANRIKQSSYYVPGMLDPITEADTPRVAIMLSGHAPHMHYATNYTQIDAVFDVAVFVSGLNIGVVNAIIWAILCAIKEARETASSDEYVLTVTAAKTECKLDRISDRVVQATACRIIVTLKLSSDEMEQLEI